MSSDVELGRATARRIAAAGLAVLVDGRTLPLSVPLVFGRAPAPARVRVGRAPRLVPLASPEGMLSATHCEVRRDGANVVVTDLASTNGTVVTTPIGRSTRLRPWESAVVPVGSRIDLAGEVRLDIVQERAAEVRA